MKCGTNAKSFDGHGISESDFAPCDPSKAHILVSTPVGFHAQILLDSRWIITVTTEHGAC